MLDNYFSKFPFYIVITRSLYITKQTIIMSHITYVFFEKSKVLFFPYIYRYVSASNIAHKIEKIIENILWIQEMPSALKEVVEVFTLNIFLRNHHNQFWCESNSTNMNIFVILAGIWGKGFRHKWQLRFNEICTKWKTACHRNSWSDIPLDELIKEETAWPKSRRHSSKVLIYQHF